MALYYLDTSAALKRVVKEEHQTSLINRLRQLVRSDQQLCTSVVTWIEVERSLRALISRGVLPADYRVDLTAPHATAGLAKIRLGSRVTQMARWIGPNNLRSLDAIHLASAVIVGANTLITYDNKLAVAAAASGLTVESPGTNPYSAR